MPSFFSTFAITSMTCDTQFRVIFTYTKCIAFELLPLDDPLILQTFGILFTSSPHSSSSLSNKSKMRSTFAGELFFFHMFIVLFIYKLLSFWIDQIRFRSVVVLIYRSSDL